MLLHILVVRRSRQNTSYFHPLFARFISTVLEIISNTIHCTRYGILNIIHMPFKTRNALANRISHLLNTLIYH